MLLLVVFGLRILHEFPGQESQAITILMSLLNFYEHTV